MGEDLRSGREHFQSQSGVWHDKELKIKALGQAASSDKMLSIGSEKSPDYESDSDSVDDVRPYM